MIMGSVAIFCAASENIAPGYFEAAAEVGAMLGRLGKTMVYGGARFGLMEATAKAAKAAGARIVGVVPDILVERTHATGQCHQHVTALKHYVLALAKIAAPHLFVEQTAHTVTLYKNIGHHAHNAGAGLSCSLCRSLHEPETCSAIDHCSTQAAKHGTHLGSSLKIPRSYILRRSTKYRNTSHKLQ